MPEMGEMAEIPELPEGGEVWEWAGESGNWRERAGTGGRERGGRKPKPRVKRS